MTTRSTKAKRTLTSSLYRTRKGEQRPFCLGETQVAPGERKEIDLVVARLPTGTPLALNLTVLHGRRPGPAMWLSAAIHGDELNGVAIIHRLLQKVSPDKLSGTLITVPVVNVFGFINGSRYLPDRRDLNRSFPGSKRGSLASQIAHLFTTHVVDQCDLGLDLHTGAGGRTNLPQIRCNLEDAETRRLARRFGADALMHATLRDGSLRAAASERGVRVLLYEAGEAGRLDQDSIRKGVGGTLRVMQDLGMVAKKVSAGGDPSIECHTSSWARAPRSGLCELKVKLGQHVEENDELAVVYDTTGDELAIPSPVAGIVIGCSTMASITRGDAIVHVAQYAEAED